MTNTKQYAKKLIAVSVAATLLSGCVGAVLGGVAVGGAAAVDRRSLGTQTDDNIMEVRIQNTALDNLRAQGKTSGVQPKLSVVVYNQHALLLGHVASEEDKALVEQVARSQPAVQQVYNYISVSSQPRTFAAISGDTWSTSRVRTTLLGIHGVIPSRVKIVTYDGVTYVMGILTPAEQAAVTQRVSTTAGVKKVVTLYQNYDNGQVEKQAEKQVETQVEMQAEKQ